MCMCVCRGGNWATIGCVQGSAQKLLLIVLGVSYVVPGIKSRIVTGKALEYFLLVCLGTNLEMLSDFLVVLEPCSARD